MVTAIVPTANRRPFIPGAIRGFQAQDYSDAIELIIIDDGTDPIEDLIPPDDCRIRYIRLNERHTVGAKRNLACRLATGDIVLHFDDDDWAAPWRVRYQVEQLQANHAELCGLDHIYYYEPSTQRAWQYQYAQNGRPWVSGNTLCYRKAFWQNHPFPEIDIAEDARFVWQAAPRDVLRLQDSRFLIAFVHESNVSPKITSGCYWTPQPVSLVHSLMGSPLPPKPRSEPESRGHGMTYALKSDLDLPEFAAYRQGLNLPLMRTWELPYALSAARLSNGMSVLDCTINPAGFGERLAQLYPHLVYRHWNPVRGGEFMLPAGFSDNGFDRIFCINTLEHLLAPQRASLVAELAGKLKPGGRLILTSDYYFDCFWSQPELIRCGLVRADRAEVFNGFNKVTTQDWIDLCRPHGLEPVAGSLAAEPREDDFTLFRNHPPYPHATIGGVFQKRGQALQEPSFRILLSLLSWNTRQASVDSVNAYVREAQMLQRMGHVPSICVCDNGSDDGTPGAMRLLEQQIPFPHRFVYNTHNLGNSIGRNQIIQYAREVNADYVLFMDGDIEIVPFSSLAMLCYLEANGLRVGCIGAYSLSHTPFRERASKCLYSIDSKTVQTTNLVSWTQYGLFRRAVFEDNIRFDETGPFGGPGWGYEDNDLAFQMEMKGYRNDYFTGLTYLHRNVRSSVYNLRRAGLDANQLCHSRRQYLIDKWTSFASISSGPLEQIRRSHITL